jgi:hypothetical protein
MRIMDSIFYKKQVRNIDQLIPLDSQTRKDSWQAVRGLVADFLSKKKGSYSLAEIRTEYKSINRLWIEGTREVRTALNEITGLMKNDSTTEEDPDLS